MVSGLVYTVCVWKGDEQRYKPLGLSDILLVNAGGCFLYTTGWRSSELLRTRDTFECVVTSVVISFLLSPSPWLVESELSCFWLEDSGITWFTEEESPLADCLEYISAESLLLDTWFDETRLSGWCWLADEFVAWCWLAGGSRTMLGLLPVKLRLRDTSCFTGSWTTCADPLLATRSN